MADALEGQEIAAADAEALRASLVVSRTLAAAHLARACQLAAPWALEFTPSGQAERSQLGLGLGPAPTVPARLTPRLWRAPVVFIRALPRPRRLGKLAA